MLPGALEHVSDLAPLARERGLALFLDYDGTLAPIVLHPEAARMAGSVRRAVEELARMHPVAIVSGRDRLDLEEKVGIAGLVYAGSHGFDVEGPGIRSEVGMGFLDALAGAADALRSELPALTGLLVERKKYAVAVHYRLVADEDVASARDAFDRVAARFPTLRTRLGKKVFELQPDLAWDKGRCVVMLLEGLRTERGVPFGIYIGDDATDEDAFRELATTGMGIVVSPTETASAARYRLRDPGEVESFLWEVAKLGR
jgi:trehalose 6-phosphate phosphatase